MILSTILLNNIENKKTEMDRLNNLSSYFNEKERKRLNAIAQQNTSGLPEMSVRQFKFLRSTAVYLILVLSYFLSFLSLMKSNCPVWRITVMKPQS